MPYRTCSVDGCNVRSLARSYCRTHYRRFMKHGDPHVSLAPTGGTLMERFWDRVDIQGPDECWPWIGQVNDAGYGLFWVDQFPHRAHRLSYELFNGPIPDGLVIDHVLKRGCTQKRCVNPSHLEAVTTQENIRRAPESASTLNAAKTHCVNGHEFTPDNIYTAPSGGRRCRICRVEKKRNRRLQGAIG